MELLTLSEARRRVQSGPVEARVHVQVDAAAGKTTRDGKPYCELMLADAGDRLMLRVWSDNTEYKSCELLHAQDFIELSGEFFQHQQYGLDAKQRKVRALTASETADLLAGPPELRAKQAQDFAYISEGVKAIGDPRLRALCETFLADHGDRFKRTAGARTYHHARRGGLVEHTAQMMRVAAQLAPLYPELNLDLLRAGILFHDSGKLWENHLPETGFTMPFDELGELMGHISIGIELVNSLWRKLQGSAAAESWKQITPASEDVRLHLLHVIGAHHGELQFGSPVVPKTPEAMALHYIDNMDVRLEMFAAGYLVAKPLADRVFDRVRPLPGNLVKPLGKFQA